MHVAVDAHNLLADHRGIGVYLRSVLRQVLAKRAYRLTLLSRRPFPALQKRALARELDSAEFAVAPRVPDDADVVWHPWNGTFFQGGRRNVVTIHDVAPFVFPASYLKLLRSEQEPFEVSARIADRIVTNSHSSKSGIVAELGVEPERITVVPLAAGEVFSPGTAENLPRALRGRRYILYVGTLEERKNPGTLIDAWREKLKAQGIALAMVSTDKLPKDVIALRNLDSKHFRDVYRAALCLAYPTLYEGFGLPALEAMACGTPAVVSRVASLPEVCGTAAFYVEEPCSVAEWASALQEIAASESLRSDLSRRGLEQAAKFSWEATANQTFAVIAEAAA